MNSTVDLRESRSVSLLHELTKTCASYAETEGRLLRDLNGRRHSATRKFRETTESAAGWAESQIAEIEGRAAEEAARVNESHGKRAAKILRAFEGGRREIPSRARGEKERWLGGLQMRHIHAERKMNEGIAEARKAHATYTATVAEQAAIISGLENRARSVFRGYWPFFRTHSIQTTEAKIEPGEPEELIERMKTSIDAAAQDLIQFRRLLLPKIFAYAPLPVLLLLILGVGWFAGVRLGGSAFPIAMSGAVMVAVGLVGVYWSGLRQSALATSIAEKLAEARRIEFACGAASQESLNKEQERLKAEFEQTCESVNEKWGKSADVAKDFEKLVRDKIDAQFARLKARHESRLTPKLTQIEDSRSRRVERVRAEAEAAERKARETHDTEVAALAAEETRRWAEVEETWHRDIIPLFREIDGMNAALSSFKPWSREDVEKWTPPVQFPPAAKFGGYMVDLTQIPGGCPKSARLPLPGPAKVSIPLALSFPERASLLFETADASSRTLALGNMNNVILRLLASLPPGKVAFTIIDPVGLGQSFAGLMHLADYEEGVINRRIWTQRDQIEERIAELSAHIEKVIQMYLRTEYRTITEYNAQAGSVAEKYHFLVVADFPADFSEVAGKGLQSIIASGPRCGVYTLVQWNRQMGLPDGLAADDLRRNSICMRGEYGRFTLGKERGEPGPDLVLDPPPDPALGNELIHKIGKSSVDSNRVEVPFVQVAPKPEEMWAGDTTNEVRIAIGRTGATKLQYLAIGKGTRQHALFAGKTGSGKSTLFHVIITNLALACSPDQIEFYLIDFKKGVEFKCYATKHLPHARVVAIESDREFGLSVLQRVDEELKRRGDIFRKLGVQDVAGYKKAGGADPMPRTLLIIDEFQEFFVEDDQIAQGASLLFDRIVRQGRAFGIHVLLGSQTLGGAYSLARATLGQMVIRVALQCNEADAYLIMDENNSAPRLLTRPGEGIYNDAAGAMEGNSPFQVVWLPDDERDEWLDKVQDISVRSGVRRPGPIVFEGNAPADIRENELLRVAIERVPSGVPAVGRIWLGAPNSIKGPTEVRFQPQSGNNLLIVGQREEAAQTLIGVSLLALAAQYREGSARFVVLHAPEPGAAGGDLFESIAGVIPHEVTLARNQDVPKVMQELSAELKARSGEEEKAAHGPVFLFINGLQRFKKLRQEDDFDFSMSGSDSGSKPGAQFTELICEGPSHGMHVIASVDTFNNVGRFISRKALSEFEMRVVFQMSANDSASLIDSPKASGLGLHRALLYNEHEGTLETFRPYAQPDPSWIGWASEAMAGVTKR